MQQRFVNVRRHVPAGRTRPKTAGKLSPERPFCQTHFSRNWNLRSGRWVDGIARLLGEKATKYLPLRKAIFLEGLAGV